MDKATRAAVEAVRNEDPCRAGSIRDHGNHRYDNTFRLEEHKPADPIQVFLMPKTEDLDLVTREELGGDFEVDIAIRHKVASLDRDGILILREFTDTVFYYWSKYERRRVSAVEKTWIKTTIHAAFIPSNLTEKSLFFAIATLSFNGIR